MAVPVETASWETRTSVKHDQESEAARLMVDVSDKSRRNYNGPVNAPQRSQNRRFNEFKLRILPADVGIMSEVCYDIEGQLFRHSRKTPEDRCCL